MSQAPPTNGSRRLALVPEVRLRLLYRDSNLFGGDISGVAELYLKARLAVLQRYRRRFGVVQMVGESRRILERVLPRCLDGIRVGPDRLNPAWLYPDPARIGPGWLAVERDVCACVATIPLPAALWSDLASYVGDWQRGSTAPRTPAARQLWDALAAAGALAPAAATAAAPAAGAEIRFVGHATVRLADDRTALLVDPFLMPKSALLPADWQPLAAAELGPVDAILITHSHPDHFDPGALLRFGADTPILVPAVGRESILAIDMAARLGQLGFHRVEALQPWSERRIGTLRVVALPFHGEQPTTGAVLHPEVRNVGLTYLVELAGRRVALIADAGRDGSGDIGDTALQACRRYGRLDTLFGGNRGFGLYPIQYAFSSVMRYLPFVPPELWGVRQQIMCDAAALLDVGELWGARQVVPYAAGGAPWHWLRGLGPRLDQPRGAAGVGEPWPDDVVAAAGRRGFSAAGPAIASPLQVRVLRPGERL